MATPTRLTYTRLQEVMRRQDPPRWGADYDPGIRATREEAPSKSRYLQLWSEKLGRYVHALSGVESPVVILALMNPALFELQEQRMLSMEPRPHPLASHPMAVGLNLPPLRGTISVVGRLDLFSHHQWFKHRDSESDEQSNLPFPFFGDLLLFLQDDLGPYCINLTIKQTEDDFNRSMSIQKRIRNPEKDTADAKARHAIEELYYQDAKIRTVRVVEENISDNLAHNIRSLFLHQRLVHELAPHILSELEDRLRASFTTGESPLSLMLSMTHRHDCEFDHLRCAFFHTLWHRRVRVDLIDEVILIDRPLRPERIDLFKHFAFLFSRDEA